MPRNKPYHSIPKQTEIPVKKHLLHFAKWMYQKDVITIDRLFVSMDRNHAHAKKYFDQGVEENWPILTVEMMNPSLIARYRFVRSLEEAFRQQMLLYVVFSRCVHARDAIREFLFVQLDLDECDYNVESAYKDFQRRRAVVRKREEIYMASTRLIGVGGKR